MNGKTFAVTFASAAMLVAGCQSHMTWCDRDDKATNLDGSAGGKLWVRKVSGYEQEAVRTALADPALQQCLTGSADQGLAATVKVESRYISNEKSSARKIYDVLSACTLTAVPVIGSEEDEYTVTVETVTGKHSETLKMGYREWWSIVAPVPFIPVPGWGDERGIDTWDDLSYHSYYWTYRENCIKDSVRKLVLKACAEDVPKYNADKAMYDRLLSQELSKEALDEFLELAKQAESLKNRSYEVKEDQVYVTERKHPNRVVSSYKTALKTVYYYGEGKDKSYYDTRDYASREAAAAKMRDAAELHANVEKMIAALSKITDEELMRDNADVFAKTYCEYSDRNLRIAALRALDGARIAQLPYTEELVAGDSSLVAKISDQAYLASLLSGLAWDKDIGKSVRMAVYGKLDAEPLKQAFRAYHMRMDQEEQRAVATRLLDGGVYDMPHTEAVMSDPRWQEWAKAEAEAKLASGDCQAVKELFAREGNYGEFKLPDFAAEFLAKAEEMRIEQERLARENAERLRIAQKKADIDAQMAVGNWEAAISLAKGEEDQAIKDKLEQAEKRRVEKKRSDIDAQMAAGNWDAAIKLAQGEEDQEIKDKLAKAKESKEAARVQAKLEKARQLDGNGQDREAMELLADEQSDECQSFVHEMLLSFEKKYEAKRDESDKLMDDEKHLEAIEQLDRCIEELDDYGAFLRGLMAKETRAPAFDVSEGINFCAKQHEISRGLRGSMAMAFLLKNEIELSNMFEGIDNDVDSDTVKRAVAICDEAISRKDYLLKDALEEIKPEIEGKVATMAEKKRLLYELDAEVDMKDAHDRWVSLVRFLQSEPRESQIVSRLKSMKGEFILSSGEIEVFTPEGNSFYPENGIAQATVVVHDSVHTPLEMRRYGSEATATVHMRIRACYGGNPRNFKNEENIFFMGVPDVPDDYDIMWSWYGNEGGACASLNEALIAKNQDDLTRLYSEQKKVFELERRAEQINAGNELWNAFRTFYETKFESDIKRDMAWKKIGGKQVELCGRFINARQSTWIGMTFFMEVLVNGKKIEVEVRTSDVAKAASLRRDDIIRFSGTFSTTYTSGIGESTLLQNVTILENMSHTAGLSDASLDSLSEDAIQVQREFEKSDEKARERQRSFDDLQESLDRSIKSMEDFDWSW